MFLWHHFLYQYSTIRNLHCTFGMQCYTTALMVQSNYELNKHNKLMGMSNVNKHKKDNKAYIWFDIELVLWNALTECLCVHLCHCRGAWLRKSHFQRYLFPSFIFPPIFFTRLSFFSFPILVSCLSSWFSFPVRLYMSIYLCVCLLIVQREIEPWSTFWK